MSKQKRRTRAVAALRCRAAGARTDGDQRVREASALNRLSGKVSASLSLDKVVAAALEGITATVAPDLAMLFLKEGDDLHLQGIRARRPSLRKADVPIHRVGECMCGLAAQDGQALYSLNIHDDPRCTWDECKQAGLISFAALPLRGAARVLGVLGLASGTRQRDFAEQATFLETLSNEIAIGLQNALLYEEVRRNSAALARVNQELRGEIAERRRVEEALRENDERLRQLVENLNEVLWLTDWKKRELLYVSPNYAAVYGRSRDSLFANRRSWIEAIHPEDRARVDRVFAEKGERGEYTEEEYRITRPDGSIRWIRDRSFPLRDAHGQVFRWVGVAEDITARKLAEGALQSATERLGLIARTTAAVVGAAPLEEQARELARQVRAVFGVDACVIRILDGDQLVLLACDGLPEGLIRPSMPAAWGIGGKVLATQRPVYVADVHQDAVLAGIARDEPSAFCFTSYAGAPLLLDRRVIGILGIYKNDEMGDFDESSLDHLQILADNITVAIVNDRLHRELMSERDRLAAEVIERRRTEERLRESEQRHRLLTEHSHDIIFRSTVTGSLLHVSPACRPITGYTPEEMVGRSGPGLVHPDDQQLVQQCFAEMVERPGVHTLSFRSRSKDRGYVWLEVTAEAVRGAAADAATEIFGVARDVTARKDAEQNLQERRSELARVSRLTSLAQLTAGIAHELNQPLCAIVTYADSCLRAARSGRARPGVMVDDLQNVILQAERASAVIRRLRETLKRRPPRRATMDVRALVKDVLLLMEPELRRATVVPDVRVGAGVPRIAADRIQIEQVLINLARNALEAMGEVPANERKLTIEGREVGRQAVELSVVDTGSGIPESALEQIFEPFQTTKPEGMGLGLSISRAIAEAHGGRLWAERAPGRGSIFRLSLPTLAEGR